MDNVENDERTHLTAPIVGKSEDKRIAYGAVLVPGEPDSDGEVLDEARVEKSAHEWMITYRNVDLQHSLNNVGFPVESYLTPSPMDVKFKGEKLHLPKGTWILAAKVQDDGTWEAVRNGSLSGYSIMGIPRTTKSHAEKSAEVSFKRTLLEDLGEDWICSHVSFVDEPAVPKARIFAMKQKPGTWDRFKEFINGSSKEGRRFSENNYQRLLRMKSELDAMLSDAESERTTETDIPEGKKEDSDMTDEEKKALKEEESQESAEDQKDESHEETDEESQETNEDLETLKSELKENKETIDSLRKELEAEKAEREKMAEEIAERIKKAGKSRSIIGHDGDADESKKESDRDYFGRKMKK